MSKKCRYPDEEAGQVPMAFVVRQPQSTLSEAEVIDFVAKQALTYHQIPHWNNSTHYKLLESKKPTIFTRKSKVVHGLGPAEPKCVQTLTV